MKNGKSILDRIRQKIPEFSAGNRAIAEYISKNPDIAAYMTVAELAEASNVSDATVVRFARNLGYSRYSELKAELKYVLRSDVRQIDRLRHSGIAIANQKSPLMQTVEKSMHADMQSIEQTLSDLKEEDIKIIVRKSPLLKEFLSPVLIPNTDWRVILPASSAGSGVMSIFWTLPMNPVTISFPWLMKKMSW